MWADGCVSHRLDAGVAGRTRAKEGGVGRSSPVISPSFRRSASRQSFARASMTNIAELGEEPISAPGQAHAQPSANATVEFDPRAPVRIRRGGGGRAGRGRSIAGGRGRCRRRARPHRRVFAWKCWRRSSRWSKRRSWRTIAVSVPARGRPRWVVGSRAKPVDTADIGKPILAGALSSASFWSGPVAREKHHDQRRTTRPHHRSNTWPHRPANVQILRKPLCQRRAVHTRPISPKTAR